MGGPLENKDEWHLTVDETVGGERLDAVLARGLAGFSRSRIKELILAGAVEIDGATIGEPKTRVKPGQKLILRAPEPVDPEPEAEDIPLTILYEDDHLIVIDKPAGLVVHPAPGTPDGTLVNALIFHCGDSLKGIGGERRPGIVHRLDKDTSGVMVAAKTEPAMQGLSAQFADHGRTGALRRTYTAFAWGNVARAGGSIDAPLGRDANNRMKQAVRKDGRHAVTHYAVKARFAGEGWDITRLDCRLETGRTHQIRVHMTHIGHPLLADSLYASGFATKANRLPAPLKSFVEKLGRQALHAAELAFEHPVTGKFLEFRAELPPDLAALDQALLPYNTTKTGR